jgi:hypothetical protein
MKTEDPALYENNTLLNDVFFYILHLPQLQNMHEYMVAAQDSDIVDVPAGEAIHSQLESFTMSEDKEDEESAAPAAAAAVAPAATAESGGDGAGPPAAGGAVDA